METESLDVTQEQNRGVKRRNIKSDCNQLLDYEVIR